MWGKIGCRTVIFKRNERNSDIKFPASISVSMIDSWIFIRDIRWEQSFNDWRLRVSGENVSDPGAISGRMRQDRADCDVSSAKETQRNPSNWKSDAAQERSHKVYSASFRGSGSPGERDIFRINSPGAEDKSSSQNSILYIWALSMDIWFMWTVSMEEYTVGYWTLAGIG